MNKTQSDLLEQQQEMVIYQGELLKNISDGLEQQQEMVIYQGELLKNNSHGLETLKTGAYFNIIYNVFAPIKAYYCRTLLS